MAAVASIENRKATGQSVALNLQEAAATVQVASSAGRHEPGKRNGSSVGAGAQIN